MTFDNTPIISFNDELGNTFAVRDKKDIGTYDPAYVMDNVAGCNLDEISSRVEVYGDGAENLAWQIFEANIISLVEAGLDEGKLKKLIIPVIRNS